MKARNLATLLGLIGGFCLVSCQHEPSAPPPDLLLQVPSPAWEDQVIYFAMIDRFNDGDAHNNDQGVGVFDPSRESHYSGGDLRGLIEQLDYIQGLGATAVWITPPVANMWWDPQNQYSGYHGYWARDFSHVDEHYGSLEDYQALSDALHRRGMYLIQDIVVNHTANYFGYEGTFDPANPDRNFRRNLQAVPGPAPQQVPFDLVDMTREKDREAGIYNFTPEILDFSDPVQEFTYQTSGLSDINTKNPKVMAALLESYRYWIEKAGVDAFRIDTVKYVEPEFYTEFLHGDEGIKPFAKTLGKQDFFNFAEVFVTSSPFAFEGEDKINQFISDSNRARVDAPIGFPLYQELLRVFAEGAPPAQLAYRIDQQMRRYFNPYRAVNFVDNHDVARFLQVGSQEGFELAYAAMMTLPGIPTIYQGDEQGFTLSRKAMFAGGYASDKNYFNQDTDLYQWIQALANFRRANTLWSRGEVATLHAETSGPGAMIYGRKLGESCGLVLLNTAKNATFIDKALKNFSIKSVVDRLSRRVEFDQIQLSGERIRAILPAHSVALVQGPCGGAIAIDKNNLPVPTIDAARMQSRYQNVDTVTVFGEQLLRGGESALAVNGELRKKITPIRLADGKWRADIPVADLGIHQYRIELVDLVSLQASNSVSFEVENTEATREHRALAKNTSVERSVAAPTHPSFGCEMELKSASARYRGSVLELELELCEVSALWAPPMKFDHVAFAIYFAFDAAKGSGEKFKGRKTLINGGNFPKDKTWQAVHETFGWGNTWYRSEGGALDKRAPAPKVEVEGKENRILFQYPGRAIGVEDWEGATIYITTWDRDGGGEYRPIGDTPGPWRFAAPQGSPKIFDSLLVEL